MGSGNYPFVGNAQTFQNDFAINNAYPGVELGGTETGALYYEDREVAGTKYFNVQNATFNKVSQSWVPIDITKPCYAMALTSGGTFEFLSAAAGTSPITTWTVAYSIDKTGSSTLAFPGVVNVKAYGAKGDGTTDDSTAVQNAVNAVNAAGGGTVYFPPGTYRINNIITPSAFNGPIFLMGGGVDVTILKATATATSTITLQGPGGFLGMTVDGNGVVTNNLIVSASYAIDRIIFKDVKARNISTSAGGWVFVVNVTGGFNLSVLDIDGMIVEGPSATAQDAMGITGANVVQASNMIFRNLHRSPNFYANNYVQLENIQVSGVAALAALVVDGPNNYATLTNIAVDATNTAPMLIGCPSTRVSNSYFLSDLQIGQSGDSAAKDISVLNCSMTRVILQGTPISKGIIANCEFATGTSGPAFFEDYASGQVLTNLLLENCVFALGTGYTSWLSSNALNTWTNVRIQNNAIVSGTNAITPAPVFSTGVLLQGNLGYNPVGSMTSPTVGASPWTYTNSTGVDQILNVSGGTVSAISANGVSTGLTAGSFHIPAGKTLVVTYSATPTVTASGL